MNQTENIKFEQMFEYIWYNLDILFDVSGGRLAMIVTA